MPYSCLTSSFHIQIDTGVRLQRCAHVGARLAPGAFQVILLENARQSHLGFDLSKGRADADARPAAKRYVGERRTALRIPRESLRPELLRLIPKPLIPVRQID